MNHPRARGSIPAYLYLLIAVLLGLVFASYVLLRYNGQWGETDTYSFARAINSVASTGELIPPEQLYANGYGYQTLITLLSSISGASLADIQQYAAVLLAIWIIPPAWLLYRELIGSARGATLGTILLLVQPELLFVLARGTHEKFTRGLILLSLWLLVRSLRSTDRLSSFAGLIICFYLSIYGVITFNSFLANSFIFAVIISLILSWLLLQISRPTTDAVQQISPLVQRLIFVGGVGLILSFIFTFYTYPPAQNTLRVMNTIAERTAALVLDVEPQQIDEEIFNPYATIDSAWVNRPAYLLLTLSNWLLLGISAGIWLAQTLRWLRHRRAPADIGTLLLWSFYGAFAVQGALSVLADLSGVGGNLQHRLFPSFTLLAVPVIARAVMQWQPTQATTRRIGYAGLASAVGVLAILSTLKATNEPMLSNKWLFHRADEIQAIHWSNRHLPEQSLWVGPDERLLTGYGIRTIGQPQSVVLDAWQIEPGTRAVLLSDVIRSQSLRLGVPLPVRADAHVLYDNGGSQIYRYRPETPYQQ